MQGWLCSSQATCTSFSSGVNVHVEYTRVPPGLSRPTAWGWGRGAEQVGGTVGGASRWDRRVEQVGGTEG